MLMNDLPLDAVHSACLKQEVVRRARSCLNGKLYEFLFSSNVNRLKYEAREALCALKVLVQDRTHKFRGIIAARC